MKSWKCSKVLNDRCFFTKSLSLKNCPCSKAFKCSLNSYIDDSQNHRLGFLNICDLEEAVRDNLPQPRKSKTCMNVELVPFLRQFLCQQSSQCFSSQGLCCFNKHR